MSEGAPGSGSPTSSIPISRSTPRASRRCRTRSPKRSTARCLPRQPLRGSRSPTILEASARPSWPASSSRSWSSWRPGRAVGLILAPGSLVEQWQDELQEKFGLDFAIVTRDQIEASLTGNPFAEHGRLILRLDMAARSDELKAKLEAAPDRTS